MATTTTHQSILSLQNTVSDLDFSSLSVSSKIKFYNIVQAIEPKMKVYQSTLQSIAKEGQQTIEDLGPDQMQELEELLTSEVEIQFEVQLEEDDLPESITIPQIGALDRAGVLSLS